MSALFEGETSVVLLELLSSQRAPRATIAKAVANATLTVSRGCAEEDLGEAAVGEAVWGTLGELLGVEAEGVLLGGEGEGVLLGGEGEGEEGVAGVEALGDDGLGSAATGEVEFWKHVMPKPPIFDPPQQYISPHRVLLVPMLRQVPRQDPVHTTPYGLPRASQKML